MRKLQSILRFIGEVTLKTILTLFVLLLLCELAHTQTTRYSATRNTMNRNVVQVEVDTVEDLENIDTSVLKLNTDEFIESKEDFEEDDKVDEGKEIVPETIAVPQDNLRKVQIVPAPVKVVDNKLKLEDPNWEDKVKPTPPAKVKIDAFDLGMNVDRSEENAIVLSELTEKGINFDPVLDTVAIERVPKVRKDEFFKKLYPKCKEFEKKYQISAALMYYQLCIESMYGCSVLAQPYGKAYKDTRKGYEGLIRLGAFNLIGCHCPIKKVHDPKCCVAGIDSGKRVYFKVYKSIDDCLEGYVKFLRDNGYMKLAHSIAEKNGKSKTNFFVWKYAVVSKGYCEDKSYYDKLLTGMNNKMQLYRTK